MGVSRWSVFKTAVLRFWWLWLAFRFNRICPLLGAIWADGLYLLRYQTVSFVLPFIALAFGFFEGATHWSLFTLWDDAMGPERAVVFIQMLPLLVVSVVLGALSAQWGLLLVLGFAVGDLVLGGPGLPVSFDPFLFPPVVIVPKCITYLLFLLLAVFPFVLSKSLVASVAFLNRLPFVLSFWTRSVLIALIEAGFVYFWSQSAAMVVRPVWTWAWVLHSEINPPLTSLFFSEMTDHLLPCLVLAASLLRAFLTWKQRQEFNPVLNIKIRSINTSQRFKKRGLLASFPPVLKAICMGLFSTLFLSGFLSNIFIWVCVFVLISFLTLIHEIRLNKIPAWQVWDSFALKVPALFRFVFHVAFMAFVVTQTRPLALSFGNSFVPTVALVVFGFILHLFLFPKNTGATLLKTDIFAPAIVKAFLLILLFPVLFLSINCSAVCIEFLCCMGASNTQAILTAVGLIVGVSILAFLLLPETGAFVLMNEAEELLVSVEEILAEDVATAFDNDLILNGAQELSEKDVDINLDDSNSLKSPDVWPKDVIDKTPEEIDELAKAKGLQIKGPDPKAGRGAYVDPVTGVQRVLVHGDHAHVNDSNGNRLDINGNTVPSNSPSAHLPIKKS